MAEGIETGGGVTQSIGDYEVTAVTGFGPRITGLSRGDGPQMLATLSPDVVIDHPQAGIYRLRGGHRLWVAPEVPTLTYAADDRECSVLATDDSLTVSGPPDSAGFEKAIHVERDGERLVVEHTLTWTGAGPTSAACWGITQLPLGGVAVLPVLGNRYAPGEQADSHIVVWPYTKLDDPRLSYANRVVLIGADAGEPLKLGSGPAPGRLGYLHRGHLFSKHIAPAANGNHPDLGAVGQVFVNDVFCELESVGPLTELTPGSQVRHRESWEIVTCPDLATAIRRIGQEGAE